jgi:asparagine synthase (glutamine-hydrolysing)
MCGIVAIIYTSRGRYDTSKVQKGIDAIVARGPEGTCVKGVNGSVPAIFGFTRLAINGLNLAGMQPFELGNIWMCNGEIYNAKQIAKHLSYENKSSSDCEPLGALWSSLKDPLAFCRALDGVFSIVLYDPSDEVYVVARDPYGVRPLYYSQDQFYGYSFASERKALEPFISDVSKVHEFPPGEVWTISASGIKKDVYHTVPWVKGLEGFPVSFIQEQVRNSLTQAVEKRLLTERPIAALLSGGLDSSLIAALVQKNLKALGLPPLKTFSIGMTGSSDLKHAREVADWIGSDHHEVVVTADEMFDCIPQVIHDIESYDITTVRASVGNWMIAREVRKTDCKVVFNGDGSDEEWGSYLYFYKAPNDYAFEEDSVRLLKEMYRYDVLRSDRSISSHGLEARTPFLDKQFVSVAMSVPTVLRRPRSGWVEKNLLRCAFDDGLLPPSVLWRKKEAFSDGVSTQEKSWFQEIQERVLERVPADWAQKSQQFVEPKPKTPEAFYYRSLYEGFYKKTGDYWPFWMPRWSPETNDPSARTLAGV